VQLHPYNSIANLSSVPISLVKIDVEGAELQVLRGMEKMLRQSRPNCLVEVTDSFLREMGDSSDALLAFLEQLGYVCYMIGDKRLTLIDSKHSNLPEQWNALFTPGKISGDINKIALD
jgi:hypothetical protein